MDRKSFRHFPFLYEGVSMAKVRKWGISMNGGNDWGLLAVEGSQNGWVAEMAVDGLEWGLRGFVIILVRE